jgi:hypothetical protein
MKWTSTAGPRQTKAVEEILRKISAEHNTHVELVGVKGVDEDSMTFWSPCSSGNREDVTREWNTLGETFQWAITKANAAAIAGAATLALAALAKTRPVDDKRRTPEEDAAVKEKVRQMDAERDAKHAESRAKIETGVAELKAQYPWAETGGSSWARGAKNLKRLLNDRWPGIKFEVKSESYSMGCSIRVRWDDGPTEKEVDAIADRFQDSDFDGMTDSTNYRGASAFRELMGHAKHVSGSRDYSNAAMEAVGKGLCRLQGVDWKPEWGGLGWRDVRGVFGAEDGECLVGHVRRVLRETPAPAGAVVRNVIRTPDEGLIVVEFERPEATKESGMARCEDYPCCGHGEGGCPRGSAATAGERGGGSVGVTWRMNPDKDGVEIRFDSKPSAATLERLKARGWRWSRFNHCWYHKQTPTSIQFAMEIAGLGEGKESQAEGRRPAAPVPMLPPLRHATVDEILGRAKGGVAKEPEAPRRFDPSMVPAELVKAEPTPEEIETKRLVAILLSGRDAVLPNAPAGGARVPPPPLAPEPEAPPLPAAHSNVVPVDFQTGMAEQAVPVKAVVKPRPAVEPTPEWMELAGGFLQ